jgi:hypothetical protein
MVNRTRPNCGNYGTDALLPQKTPAISPTHGLHRPVTEAVTQVSQTAFRGGRIPIYCMTMMAIILLVRCHLLYHWDPYWTRLKTVFQATRNAHGLQDQSLNLSRITQYLMPVIWCATDRPLVSFNTTQHRATWIRSARLRCTPLSRAST